MVLISRFFLGVSVIFGVLFLLFYTQYRGSKSEKERLRSEFDVAHEGEIKSCWNEYYRIDRDRRYEETTDEFSYELQSIDIDYKKNTGVITTNEWSEEKRKLIDESIEISKDRTQKWLDAVSEVNWPEFEMPEDLQKEMIASKKAKELSFWLMLIAFTLFIFSQLKQRYWR
ncbi:hypothetical protein [Draconibacterium mangrovi]|uniref:hypothetical protein n=1 Tax=Draconibacterium mangrovi TaxID=2697469 RepID=UPI0013D3C30F|nr:hypothetical protein [Draconibacterium mangrovi]